MWILLFWGTVFFLTAVVNTFKRSPDVHNALVEYAISLFCLAVWWILRQHQRRAGEFSHWLRENQDSIRKGGVVQDGVMITTETEFKQYQAVVSFAVVSYEIPSRFYLVGHETSKAVALTFTLCSLLVGWTGFLYGPVYAIRSVLSNLQGGKRRRVGDILDELTGHEKNVVNLTESAAENAVRIMAERGFPSGSALRLEVEGDPDAQNYIIQYDDIPRSEGREWKWQSHGVVILVDKNLAPMVEGMTIDFAAGDYVFKLPPKSTKAAAGVWDRELDA